MFSHRFDQDTTRTTVFYWLLLSFNAGFINAGGFLATGRFVTHVTGFATLFGVDMVKRQWLDAIGILSVPLFFLIGAFIAGLLIDRRVYRGQRPHYDYVMGLCCLALVVAGISGRFTDFVAFGVPESVGEAYVVLAALCMASGLQNAALTSSSGSSVRTTHLTGITTDLGLGLARLLSLKGGDKRLNFERQANRLRVGTIAAFIVGSTMGAIVFTQARYHGFLIPALIAALAMIQGRKDSLRSHPVENSVV